MAEEESYQGREKTFYQKIFKKLNIVLKSKHRLQFLDDCIDLKIVPQTLQVKPSKNEASQKSLIWNNYVNLAMSTSIKNLKIARKDAKVVLEFEENNYSELLMNIIPKFSESEKLHFKKLSENTKAKINQRLKKNIRKNWDISSLFTIFHQMSLEYRVLKR